MTPEERAARWEALKLAVGQSSIVMDMAFGVSLRYWLCGEVNGTPRWSVEAEGDLSSPIDSTQDTSVQIRGNCHAPISLTNGSLVHIHGDLADRVTVDGHSEIVIGGDILPGAGIEADGISRVFVGGNLDGFIRSNGCLRASVQGDLRGTISTGCPSTRLKVGGNFLGQMQPTREACLAWLEVQKFMPFGTLEAIAQHGYTEFEAAIGISDRTPGIYPDPAEYMRMAGQRHYCWWVIQGFADHNGERPHADP